MVEGDSQQLSSQDVELRRELKLRHVNMFAIAGSIGTGLVIGTGKPLAAGGPGRLFISYILVGFCVYCVMTTFKRDGNVFDYEKCIQWLRYSIC